uniref:Wsv082 n=1 Tax=White spot syndrome virus TaxID=92652 RepID=A0A2U9G7Z0_WSSV|nr:wsv082 [Shrimp white spot syndrome virus]AWQ61997.1 wsv082 [Shrimp white spot syndrome virus]
MGQVGTSSTATVSAILLLLLFTLKREKSQRYSNSFLYFKQVHYSPLKGNMCFMARAYSVIEGRF